MSKLFSRWRKPALTLEEQIASEIDRTGIEVTLEWQTWDLHWLAEFKGSNKIVRHTSKDVVMYAVLQLLGDAPDA